MANGTIIRGPRRHLERRSPLFSHSSTALGSKNGKKAEKLVAKSTRRRRRKNAFGLDRVLGSQEFYGSVCILFGQPRFYFGLNESVYEIVHIGIIIQNNE